MSKVLGNVDAYHQQLDHEKRELYRAVTREDSYCQGHFSPNRRLEHIFMFYMYMYVYMYIYICIYIKNICTHVT